MIDNHSYCYLKNCGKIIFAKTHKTGSSTIQVNVMAGNTHCSIGKDHCMAGLEFDKIGFDKRRFICYLSNLVKVFLPPMVSVVYL